MLIVSYKLSKSDSPYKMLMLIFKTQLEVNWIVINYMCAEAY